MKKKMITLFSIIGTVSLGAPILVATSCSGTKYTTNGNNHI